MVLFTQVFYFNSMSTKMYYLYLWSKTKYNNMYHKIFVKLHLYLNASKFASLSDALQCFIITTGLQSVKCISSKNGNKLMEMIRKIFCLLDDTFFFKNFFLMDLIRIHCCHIYTYLDCKLVCGICCYTAKVMTFCISVIVQESNKLLYYIS